MVEPEQYTVAIQHLENARTHARMARSLPTGPAREKTEAKAARALKAALQELTDV